MSRRAVAFVWRFAALVALLLASIVLVAAPASAQPDCQAEALNEQQIAQIVADERRLRQDLPEPFTKFKTVTRRQGCHYIYIEYSLPEAPESSHIFKLNQHGKIIDLQSGTSSASMACPQKTIGRAELGEIVARARASRADLPAPFAQHRVRIDRLRCLYLYFEYQLPEQRGDYQTFTIDPYGEIIGSFRSQPY